MLNGALSLNLQAARQVHSSHNHAECSLGSVQPLSGEEPPSRFLQGGPHPSVLLSNSNSECFIGMAGYCLCCKSREENEYKEHTPLNAWTYRWILSLLFTMSVIQTNPPLSLSLFSLSLSLSLSLSRALALTLSLSLSLRCPPVWTCCPSCSSAVTQMY